MFVRYTFPMKEEITENLSSEEEKNELIERVKRAIGVKCQVEIIRDEITVSPYLFSSFIYAWKWLMFIIVAVVWTFVSLLVILIDVEDTSVKTFFLLIYGATILMFVAWIHYRSDKNKIRKKISDIIKSDMNERIRRKIQ